MARLSIGSQHFQAKERRPEKKPSLSVEKAQVRVSEGATEPSETEPLETANETESFETVPGMPGTTGSGSETTAPGTAPSEPNDLNQEAARYASQNRMLAMRNSELAMKNSELLGVIEDLELQIAGLKHELDQRQSSSGIQIDKLVSMLESNQSQVLRYIQSNGKEAMLSSRKSFENLSGVVSTSTPNTSKLPLDPSLETSKSSIETSHLPDFSFNARAESTPNTIRESSDESSTISADLAMLEDRSTLDKTSSKSLIKAESLKNILDSFDPGRPSKRPVQSPQPQEPESDPLEYFAKRRALDTRARTFRDSKLQPARSVKIEVKNENDDFHGEKPAERKGLKDARKPLSTVSSNVNKKSAKDSSDEIFDFVDKVELLRSKHIKRERSA